MTSLGDSGMNLRPNPDHIRAAIDAIHQDGELFEVRVLKVRSDGPLRMYGNTVNGFYDDHAAAVRDISRISGRDAAGVYLTFNTLDPIVRNYGLNRLARADKGASDTDVTRLRHMLIDLDPVRKSLTNATESERVAAMTRLGEVCLRLRTEGWPDPLLAGSSGNGAMGLWRVDLPPSESGLIEHTLNGLAAMFDDETVTVDTSVHNPARMVRVPGTVNAKSPTPQPDRPWTLATAKVVEG